MARLSDNMNVLSTKQALAMLIVCLNPVYLSDICQVAVHEVFLGFQCDLDCLHNEARGDEWDTVTATTA